MKRGLLIQPEQVISWAFSFNDQVTASSIKETKIDAVQERYLHPILGDLFDAMIDGKYPELLESYIGPALAYFVRYAIIPDLSIKLNDIGAQIAFTQHSNAATDRQRAEMRQQARDDANALLDKAVRYIENHLDEFPEYKPEANVRKNVRSNAGIVMKR